MSLKTVSCTVTSRNQVDWIMDALNEAGFPDEDISVLLPEQQCAGEAEEQRFDGLGLGATIGGVVGLVFGWLAGSGMIASPNLNIFIAAGPIVSACGGAAAGAVLAGLLGSVLEWSLGDSNDAPNHHRINISVETGNNTEALIIRNIFQQANAANVRIIGEAPAAFKHEPQLAVH